MSQVTENNVIAAPAPMTPLREFWHYFKRNKGAVVGLAYVIIMILIAVFANFIAPHNPAEQFRDALLVPPVWQEGGSWAHILGTDDVGRDVLSRLMYGARLSMLVGCLVVVLSLVMGIVLGLVAGYFGGLVDNIIMRVVDIMLALPSLLLALVLVAIFGPLNRQRCVGVDVCSAAALCPLNPCGGSGRGEPRLCHRLSRGRCRRNASDVHQYFPELPCAADRSGVAGFL
ncbi:dipeptide transporter permease DppC [Salmonella enterica subsp. arizonae]|uniref:Dipeptide transporter permease DppC n=1 Tax=Salmonella enterica subsp. arizonae TaxID=59203 RepID=A0A2X4SXS0_SALER|nr:dipeptide transporter permease DppC [Salmonella enterica subsp. arizonae]